MRMKGVILHGGSGTRLRPLTYTDVKQLLPIAGKPVSEYALLSLIEIGITEINIIVGEVGEKEVRDYYGDGSKWGVAISYTYQGKPLGIAHAISLTESFVNNEDFVVVLGDNYFQEGLSGLYNDFKQQDSDSLIALTEVTNPSQFGIAEVENGKITKLVEKPKNPKSNLAITGAYFLKPTIFPIIKVLKPSWRNELEITEAFQIMLERGMKIRYSTIDGWWKDTGTVEEFLDCNRMVLDKINRTVPESICQMKVSGRVNIDEGVQILGETRILGPCYIGRNTILENAYIGPYSSVGSNCNIKNTEIEDTVIMDGCLISSQDVQRISESLIGPNVQIVSSSTRRTHSKFILGRDSRIEL